MKLLSLNLALYKTLIQALGLIEGRNSGFVRGVILCICAGIAELIGLSALFPFLTLLARPEIVETNYYVNSVYKWLPFESVRAFLIFAGVVTLVSVVLSNLLLFFKSAYIARYCIGKMRSLSEKIYGIYLGKSITSLANYSTGRITKDIIDQTDAVINTVLISLMSLISEGFILAIAIAILVAIDPILSTLMLGLIALTMWLLLAYTKREVGHYGEMCDQINSERFSFVLSSFSAVKEIKVFSKEISFTNMFGKIAKKMSLSLSKLMILQLLPNFFMQTISGFSVILLAIYFLGNGDNIVEIVPKLVFVAAVGLRLMPSMGKIANAVTNLRQKQSVVSNILELISTASPKGMLIDRMPSLSSVPNIRFNSVRFAYEGHSNPIIYNASFEIPPNKITAIVGKSGSGKTTLVDLMLGLLVPSAGNILIDESPIGQYSRKSLSEIFSYVHQSVYILDSTINANIAFGVDQNECDSSAVNAACKLSHFDRVLDEKACGLDFLVGERGSRLSGGQRQRLGIARALYTSPKVLILDESTNALDGNLEASIVATLQELKKRMSIVLIAHSKYVINQSDCIVMVDEGEIVAAGERVRLIDSNWAFKNYMSA